MSFVARYDGVCLECCERYAEGTVIEYVFNTTGFRHAGTCPEPVDTPDLYPVCIKCWLVHPPGPC